MCLHNTDWMIANLKTWKFRKILIHFGSNRRIECLGDEDVFREFLIHY